MPSMSLTGSLAIGRSALSASQVAIQVTGNNFANVSTPGYSRQGISLVASPDQRFGNGFIGRGVQIGGINRTIDSALQSRLWNGVSDEAFAGTAQQFLTGVESITNDLGPNSLSKELGRFFDAWSELSQSPNAEGVRALVVQQGRTIGGQLRALRSDLSQTRTQLDGQLSAAVNEANNLLNQIAAVNVNIVNSENGNPSANSLRDQRDQLVSQLSTLMDVSVVEQPSGAYDVLVGSTPVVLAGQSRGVRLETTVVNNTTRVAVQVTQDGTQLNVASGTIGGLLQQRTGVVDRTIEKLDNLASQLIFQVNRIHSTGSGSSPLTSVTGTLTMPTADTTRPLNDPANGTLAALPFRPVNGGFLVTVTNTQTGATETVRINVDLDGITSTGAPGTADDSSLASITASLDGIANLNATINPDGTLKIDAASGFTVSFGEDTSGALAVLGVNTYFTGRDATNIDVRAELQRTPGLLATGQVINGSRNDNAGALAIAGLRTTPNAALGGDSLIGSWRSNVQQIGAESSAANSRAQSASLVRANLEAQRSAVSGVSIDEESINLLNYQRQYQGAARFISVVDELTQTLLSILQ